MPKSGFVSLFFVLMLLSASPCLSQDSILASFIASYISYDVLLRDFGINQNELFGVVKYIEHLILKIPPIVEEVTCEACEGTFNFLLSLPSGAIVDILDFIGDHVCTLDKIQDSPVCQGAVDEMVPYILSGIANRFFSPHRICPAIYLCPAYFETQNTDAYINETLAGKPNKTLPVPTKRATFKVVHISDIHLDFDYTADTETQCGEPVCCKNTNGPAVNGTGAGFWGTLDANCDIPTRTVDQALRFIKENLQPDAILWTGDTIGHTIWRQTQEIDINATTWASQEMKNIFNNSIPVFPIDGNHECWPVNVYQFNSSRETPLRQAFAAAWEDWIGADAAQQVREQVFYSTVFAKFNIRVIAVDTNACQDQNYFLFDNPTDPGNQLAWLKQELLQAEAQNQGVYIIGHIPSSSCMNEWARRYEAIVDRFSYNIRGQFFGHSHADQFNVHYAKDRVTPVGVQFIAPSLTTYSDRKPSIRMFEMDVDTGLPINYFQYRLNITKYNLLGNVSLVNWDLAYNQLSEYGLDDLSFASMEQLRYKIRDDPNIAHLAFMNLNTREDQTGNATSFFCNCRGLNLEANACNNGKPLDKQSVDWMEWLSGYWLDRVGN